MSRAPLRNRLRLPALLLLAPLLCGCFEYKEVITANSDGSGAVEITASISEETASKFRAGTFSGQLPPPIREGVLRQVFSGSSGVRIAEQPTIELQEGQWRFHVLLTFEHIRNLSAVKYFKQRNIKLEYSGAKGLRFREDIFPSIIEIAKSEAAGIPQDPYASTFLATVDAPDFAEMYLRDAKLTYEVVIPGISVVSDAKEAVTLPGNFVRAFNEYSVEEFADASRKLVLELRTTLPAESNFLGVVIFLLLASIVGMLIPGLRLLMLKSRGAA